MGAEANPVVALAVVLIVVFACGAFVAPRRRKAVPDDPDQSYSIFTTAFDTVCAGRDLVGLLERNQTAHRFSSNTETPDPRKRLELAEQAYQSTRETFAASGLKSAQASHDLAIAFLVDQSGSMANRMPALAGQLKAAIEHLESLGIAAALLGFTTDGWRGGKAREAWKQQGRPARPGRLCALLHIIYKTFEAPMADEDWVGLLRADALRENVDGEALEWAVGVLKERKAARRILIVFSDGAPVDDSTLTENGGGFLWRHFLKVIAEIVSEGSISLGAIGVEHRVDDVYPTAASVTEVGEVPEALQGLLTQLLA